ncbi:hypothetical protein P3T76_007439 [Phytophthora citrophthora]|uniref:RxLR effector protein n=1 Tax=Phytophthora citrophthora TaxID=4793 RepID=A0AAD9LLR6_9STRA|nr:hypothetical protein P3T76_007439 [Phytophthora citrophthora]
MRLTYILAVSVVATLHVSTTAFSSAQDANVAIENGVVPAIVDPTPVEGGRMLRRVDNDYDDLDGDDLDDDDLEEERGFGDVVKKPNPVTAVKKSAKKTAEQSAKIKEALKDAADYQKMIEKAREAVYKD